MIKRGTDDVRRLEMWSSCVVFRCAMKRWRMRFQMLQLTTRRTSDSSFGQEPHSGGQVNRVGEASVDVFNIAGRPKRRSNL